MVLFAMVWGAASAHAQLGCTHAEQRENLHAEHPEWLANHQSRNVFLEQYTQQFTPPPGLDALENLLIPVVFHVVHDNGEENISDDQIHEAIAQLNEDFAAENPEITEVHPEFTELVANVGVAFRLADFDPNGAPTTGINRLQSELTYNGSDLALKQLVQWDPTMYLNVWVVRSSDGGNGSAFAFYPADVEGNASIYDGIVASHWAVGRTGTAVWTHYKILTHEVGHWANLKHTWGDQSSNQSTDGCAYDDAVEDTPNTIGNTGCNLEAASCGSLDNVQNYMDYSNCSNMFTEGQKARMVAALCSDVAGRNNLWSPENHTATFLQTDFLPRLVYEGGAFEEHWANDGTVDSEVGVVLLDLAFAAEGMLVEGSDFTVEGLPEGTQLSITVSDSTHATLHLTGQVAAHAAADGVDSIAVHFTAAPFAGVALGDIYNPSRTDLALQFLDPYAIVFVDLVDDAHNFFEGRRWTWFTMGAGGADWGFFHYDLDQIKLETYGNAATCHPGTSHLMPLPAGTEIGPATPFTEPGPWYPQQLDLSNPSYTDWNGTTAYVGVRFSRNGLHHYGWIRLRVSADGTHYYALDMAYNEAPEAALLTGQVATPTLAYSQTTFHEAEANTGGIAAARPIDLFGAHWADFDSLSPGAGFTLSNLPDGLSAHLVRLSDTRVQLALTGNATSHADTDDRSDLVLTLDPSLIDSPISTPLTRHFALDFADPYGIVHQVIPADDPISIADPGQNWKWFSIGVGDGDFGLWYINDHFRFETYSKSGVCTEGTTNLAALAAGDSIGASSNWEYFSELETQLVVTSPTHLDWNGTSAFAGFKFTIAERFHYGWMRFAVSAAGDSVQLVDYAYNAKPGEAIAAGQLYAPYGCTDPDGLNFNPFATEDDGTCTYPLDCGGDVTMHLALTDSYGDGWNGNVLTFTDLATDAAWEFTLNGGSEGEEAFCLAHGCYAYAAGGGAYLNEIAWELLGDSTAVASGSGGDAGWFALGADCSFLVGCTDEAAGNFNPDALEDDGSCTYPVLGCTDEAALNYDAAADTDDGTCYYESDVLGCTDEAALNFDAEATYDDGTCAYPPLDLAPLAAEWCLGDTLQLTWTGGHPDLLIEVTLGNATLNLNLGQIALVPNTGSFTWVVADLPPGDPTEYMLYIQESPWPPASWSYSTWFTILPTDACAAGCAEDFNGDGIVTISDLLVILGEFGCAGDCTCDLNGDALVSIADFLLFLAEFGADCGG